MFRKNAQDGQFVEDRQPGEPPLTGGSSAGSGAAAQDREQLPAGNGLPELVALMDRERAHTLQLDQHGNEMTALLDPSEKPERKTVVDTESVWFDAVASLYTAAQGSERGPWRRAEIMISTVREGARTVEVEYTFPNSDRPTREAYTQVVEPAEASSAETSASGAGDPADERPAQDERPAAEGLAEPNCPADAEPADADADASSDTALAALAADAERRQDEAAAPQAEQASEEAVFVSSEEPQASAEEREVLGTPEARDAEDEAEAPAPVDASLEGRTADAPDAASAPADAVAADSSAPEPAPETVAASADAPSHPASAAGPAQTAPEPGAGVAAALPDSVPATADHADIAPSYAAPARAEKPSETHLAEGNLVLTESAVLQRLGEAQAALFGPGGTARDVSSVLVRVRALGSYYDALTHVRRDGAWDQRKTFELVPEEALHILDLKSDSYLEGSGSPLAMMFRFTPGLPPQVSFDYQDEESFVKYRDRLPAQQYIEELRLFPRTGVNIPEHMNEALTQWSL